MEQPPRLIVCKRQTHGTFCWFRRDADLPCISLKDCLHSGCGIATRGGARTFSEGMRRSTVAHFARKVRGTNIVAAKHVGCSNFRKISLRFFAKQQVAKHAHMINEQSAKRSALKGRVFKIKKTSRPFSSGLECLNSSTDKVLH